MESINNQELKNAKEITNEFERIESINKLQPNQLSTQFDIYKDFEMRELFEKKDIKNNNQSNTNTNTNTNTEMDTMINSLPYINDNIRSNINFSVEIYKKIKNFDYNYIHSIINEKSKK